MSVGDCELFALDSEWVSGKIIELPANDVRRIKLLHVEITKRLSDRIDYDRSEEASFILLKNLGSRLKVDNCSLIDTFPGDDDLYFVLHTKRGPQLPLVTKDLSVMADFVCMYILARIDQLSQGYPREPVEDAS